MRILALDLGDSCGWAMGLGDETASGAVTLKILDDEHPGARWPRIRQQFIQLAVACQAEWIAWEKIITPASRKSSYSPANLFALEANLVEVAYSLGKETKTVMPSSLKKFATGSGRATKDDMRAAGRLKWPDRDFETHDEIDARWVLEWARAELKEAIHAGNR